VAYPAGRLRADIWVWEGHRGQHTAGEPPVASGGGELFSAISHLVVDHGKGISYNYLMTKTHKTTPLDILRAIRANSRRWSSGEQTYEQFGAEGIRLWALAKTLGMVDAVSDLMHSDIAEARQAPIPASYFARGAITPSTD